MTDSQAKRFFLVAAIAVAAATVALLIAGDGPGETESRGVSEPIAETRHAVGELGLAPPEKPFRDPHGHERPADAGDRRAARDAALTFVRALLSYQAGEPRRAWLSAFQAVATASLAHELSRRPPRPPEDGRDPEGRIVSLEVYGPERGRIRASALVAYGNASRSLLDLDLRRRAAGWRVVALYP